MRIETSQAALPPAVQFELNPLVVTLRRSHPLPAPPSESIATHNDSDAAASAAAGSLALVVAGAVVERPVDDVADSPYVYMYSRTAMRRNSQRQKYMMGS